MVDEEIKEFIEFMIRESGEKINPPLSFKCMMILDEPVSRELCYDFRGIRRRVMCRAWKLMEDEKISFGEAVRRAWRETKKECALVGAII